MEGQNNKRYKTFGKRWFQYCGEKSVDPFCATIETVAEFSTYLFHQGLRYSPINIARMALSSVGLIFDGFSVRCHPLVIRLMKGVFLDHQNQNMYIHVMYLCFKYLRKLSPVKF